ncbi:MAG: hypothetical protein HN790_04245, partial [Methylococcales bacterium]|nr:hypothetical protein [Methylococcales bacterium]
MNNWNAPPQKITNTEIIPQIAATPAEGVTTNYQEFIDRGLGRELIPIAPVIARLSAPGKLPGDYTTGQWRPMGAWSSGATTASELSTWQQWPEHNIGMRT